MEVKVNVEISLCPELMALLGRNVSRVIVPAEASNREGTTPPEEAREQETADEAPATAPEAKAEPVKAEETAEYVPPTDEELKTLLDITIARLTGDNGWRESKDPATVAIRRGCSEAFKGIAKHLGAEKPTAVAPENRKEFVEQLENIGVTRFDDAGKLPEVTWLPF